MKNCKLCHLDKDSSEFGPDRRRPDGLKGECKACLKEYFWARRRKLNPEWFQRTDQSRFWELAEKSEGCWTWHGTLNGHGYGQFYMQHKRFPAHRASWLLSFGDIPEGLFVLHRCDNPLCVRPDHLFLGTHKDNMRDMQNKGRRGRPPRVVNQGMADEIRRLAGTGARRKDIAERFGISWRHVCAIIRGDYW